MRGSKRYRILALLVGFAIGQGGFAQEVERGSLTEPPRILGDYLSLLRKDAQASDPASASRTPRLQMFRMPSGFLANPLGLVSDDDPVSEDPTPKFDDFPNVQITLGNHVPYLDMYRPGDPGGFGYYMIHSQVQIFDLGTTNVSVALQAVAPAGLQSGGVANGTTVLMPALACFQDLGDGSAFHAYIGQQINANSRWRDQMQAGFRCGLAYQQPVPYVPCSPDQGLYMFIQALGEYRSDNARSDNKATTWELIPGLHWRMNNACWMSMGISRYNFLSCTWQY